MFNKFKRYIKTTKLWNLYKWYAGRKHAKRAKYLQVEGEELLSQFSKALCDEGIIFWLDFGTLLGYYREHDFIKGDFDLDVAIYLKDIDAAKKALTKNGFVQVKEFTSLNNGGKELCYRYKHTTIDVFCYREEGDHIYCNSFTVLDYNGLNKKSTALVKKIVLPKSKFVESEYKGSKVYVPEDTETYLKWHYGETFMIPNPNFNYKKEATNITYYKYDEMPGEFVYYEMIR